MIRIAEVSIEKRLDEIREAYPKKFAPIDEIFSHIHRGDRIFIGTGCGQPQRLVDELTHYVEDHPKAFFDAEVLQTWTLGITAYTRDKFRRNFRPNSFFISDGTRGVINEGLADYTPIFLSEVPDLFYRGIIPIDVALVQTSPPDRYGYISLGISVDIVRAAVDSAKTIICQPNPRMPRTLGDSFVHVEDVDFLVPHEEPLLEYPSEPADDIAKQIGNYVARLIEDETVLQVGYGRIPDAILANLSGKRHLGVHTELLSDGLVALMRQGVIDNSKKNILPNKAVAAFCMGGHSTYDYLDNNPGIEFRPVEYTNNPRIIAQNVKMTAINTALEIDLSGQATAESLGKKFYSGIGGQADFMRGAVMAPQGKSIIAIESTAKDGEVSRIVPFLSEGAGVTLTKGDVHYVVTEYGIAQLQGKNTRERVMELIRIAHPKFRPWLLKQAKKLNLIYQDQAFVPGEKGQYPDSIETYRTTEEGLGLLLRPVKISDELLLKDFFYSLSDKSLYQRFISARKDMPHERLQEFVVIDYTREMVILAVIEHEDREFAVGVGQYGIDEASHTAEVALVVRDNYQNRGIGTELLNYLTLLAKREGLFGFTAEVVVDNQPMLHLFEKAGFDVKKRREAGVYELKLIFR
ncbi:MAG: GNAT family N-acetyltransferase [Candidatus Bipolaricaulota bacterium]|nr:GNAT family N-acetyltransferase [Candidatus Bipolaricaulota bacterium]